MTESDIRELAKNFFDGIERGDLDAVIGSYAETAAIWHNTDNKEQSPEDNRRTLTGFIRFVPVRRYTNRRLTVFPGGFVHQHDLEGENAAGEQAVVRTCIVCQVANGKITRLDEYMDSAEVAAITKLAQS